MDDTELSLEQLEGCNAGILTETLIGYKIVKAIDGTSKDRPINQAINKARRKMPEPLRWLL